MISKYLIVVSLLILAGGICVKAQEFNVINQFKLGGDANDVVHDLISLSDGGYIIAGSSNSGISGDKDSIGYGLEDIWVIRVDSLGNKLDEIVLGGSGSDNVVSIQKLSSNRILIAGNSNSPVSGNKSAVHFGSSDYWLVILNIYDFGEIVTQKSFGANQDESLAKVLVTDNSELILCGQSNSNASGDKSENVIGSDDFWIAKVHLYNDDSIGGIIWENTIGGNGNDQLRDAIMISNEKFMVAGYSVSDISGDKTEPALAFDYWVVSLDTSGSLISQKTIGGDGSDFLYRAFRNSSGQIILSGSSYSNLSGDKDEENFVSGQLDYWIVAIDTLGTILWQNTITADQADNLYGEVVELADGSYIVAGESFSGNTVGGDKNMPSYGVSDVWMLNLDEQGDIISQFAIGGVSYEQLRTLKKDTLDQIIIAGSSSSDSSLLITENSINESNDFWLVKIKLDMTTCEDIANITPLGPTEFCAGSNVILSAPLDAGYAYQWIKNGSNILGATNSNYTALTTGYYQVSIIDNTCSDLSDSILVTRYAKPSANITNVDGTNNLCLDASIKLKANSGAGFTYQWYKGASPLAGATTQIYFATTTGNYKVKVTAPSGCNKTSSPYSIIKPCREADEFESIAQLTVFPNPNDGRYTLEFNSECNTEILITIYDSFGRIILVDVGNLEGNLFNKNYDLSTYAKGSYLVKVVCDEGVRYVNVIVQ